MRALLALVVVVSACGFEGATGSIDGPPGTDGSDLPGMCSGAFLNLCLETVSADSLVVNGTQQINTDDATQCTKVLAQPGGPSICLKYVQRVEIPVGAKLVVSGSRAFALAAKSEIVIAGTLDVSSRRDPLMVGAGSLVATQAACAFPSAPESDIGGAGGGAGGSYATQGGVGGTGDLDGDGVNDGTASPGSPGMTAGVSPLLRGGCPGQTGANNSGEGIGGGGGGAVYLAAPMLSVGGSVLATGAAGNGGSPDSMGGGGGGGGSGGMIVLEGASISVTGLLLATGGGGGQGGTNVSIGEQGSEPTTTAAAAGGNQRPNGGRGGAGGSLAAAGVGVDDDFGGGGGGGGVGYIRILNPSASVVGASIAPVPHPE